LHRVVPSRQTYALRSTNKGEETLHRNGKHSKKGRRKKRKMSYEGEMNEGRKEEEKQRVGERGRGSDKRGDNDVEREGGDKEKEQKQEDNGGN